MSELDKELEFFKEKLKRKEEELYFEGRGSSHNVIAKALAEELNKSENSHVKSLEFKWSSMTAEGARHLGEALAKSVSLTSLHLCSTTTLGDEGVALIARGVMENTSLVVLELEKVGMTQASAEPLCEMLGRNKTLVELNLCRNHQLKDALAAVVETVVEEGRIKRLNVGNCSISAVGTKRMFAAMQNKNTCLSSMNLTGIEFDDEGVLLFAEVLKKDAVLEELVMRSCNLGDTRGAKIMEALTSNTGLAWLSLAMNFLGPATVQAAAVMLKANKTLQALELDGNENLGAKDGCKEMLEALKSNRSLGFLSLSYCGMQIRGFGSVVEMLQCNETLTNLKLLTPTLCDAGAEALAKALVGNRNMLMLHLPSMSSDGRKRCSDVLMEGNGSLLFCYGDFTGLCSRNRKMQDLAREAVQTVRVLRNGKPNIFHVLQKDIVRMIAAMVWASRTDVKAWPLPPTKRRK